MSSFGKVISIMRTVIGAATLVLYFLVPVPISPLPFSPHVLGVVVGFFLALWPNGSSAPKVLLTILFCFVTIGILAIFNAPNQPDLRQLNTWAVSLMAFWLFSKVQPNFSVKAINVGAEIILALWSIVSLGQIIFGESWYISSWFGAPIVTVYAVGFTIYSNYAAITLVPLLVWVLVINLEQPQRYRYFLWAAGCVALYTTLSRSGWLALAVALAVLTIRLHKDLSKLRIIGVSIFIALLAVVCVWAIPTRIDAYEPGGKLSASRWNKYKIFDQFSDMVGEASLATRIVALRVALQAISEYPLTGIGPGRYPDYYAVFHGDYRNGYEIDHRERIPPHNAYAQMMAELGVPAFLLLFIFIVWILQLVSRNVKPEALAIKASLYGMLVWLMFHDGFYDRLFWILLGFAVSLGRVAFIK